MFIRQGWISFNMFDLHIIMIIVLDFFLGLLFLLFNIILLTCQDRNHMCLLIIFITYFHPNVLVYMFLCISIIIIAPK